MGRPSSEVDKPRHPQVSTCYPSAASSLARALHTRKDGVLRGCGFPASDRLRADDICASQLIQLRSAGRDMVSIMDEALELEVGHKVLEIGAGSGWHAATIAEIVAPSDVATEEWGHVYTVEIVRELVRFARESIQKAGYGDRVTVICGDGSEGYVEAAPYDRVLVTAAAPQVPKPLTEQLKNGGVLVIPVGGTYFFQSLLRVRKEDERLSEENLGGVAFVPLTGRYGHRL